MSSTSDSGQGHGSQGQPQQTLEEEIYLNQNAENAEKVSAEKPLLYVPSPKHEPGHNWGTENPIKTIAEGQALLENGYKNGKQIYNITKEGKLVKFQPDNSKDNGYHSYEVFSPPDVPPAVLRKMLQDGKISKVEYRKRLRGKK